MEKDEGLREQTDEKKTRDGWIFWRQMERDGKERTSIGIDKTSQGPGIDGGGGAAERSRLVHRI